MSLETSLELRVLNGIHRGAAVALPGLGESLRLGRDHDNDVILRDAPFRSATFRRDAESLSWIHGEDSYPLEPGQGVRWGAISLVICGEDTPWTLEPPSGWILDRLDDEVETDPPGPELSALSPDQGVDGEASPPSDVTAAAASIDEGEKGLGRPLLADPEDAPAGLRVPSTPLSPVFQKRARWVPMSVAMLVTTAGLAWGVYTYLLAPMTQEAKTAMAAAASAASSPSARDAGAPLDLPDPALVAAVKKAIERVVPEGTVRVLPYAGKRVQLLGVTGSDEKTELLVRTASAITPTLKLSLLTQAEFAQRLKSLSSSLPSGVMAKSEPLGKVIVSGTVEEATMIENLKALLSEELPSASGIAMQVQTARERAEQEARELAARTPKVPEIAAVVSGARPYVVLPDGQKVQPGGMVNGLRLSSIDSDAVIFEDRVGSRFRMAR